MIANGGKNSFCGRVAAELKNELLSGKFKPGSRFFSARVIAERFSVAYGTADKVLNLLREEQLIHRNARSGNFVSAIADGVGMLRIGYVENIYAQADKIGGNLAHFAEMLARKFRNANCDFRMVPLSELSDFPETRKFDGLLVGCQAFYDWGCPPIGELNVPLVVCRGDFLLHRKTNQILPDFADGMSKLSSVIDFDKYRGYILVFEGHSNGLERLKAMRTMLLANGVTDGQIVEYKSDCANPINNYPLWNKLSGECRNKLIMCTGDIAAMEGYHVLCSKQVVFNRDTELVSIDNLEGYGFNREHEKVLTSLDFSRELVTTAAVNMLLNLCRHPELNKCAHLSYIPGNLIIRKTAFMQTQPKKRR